MKKIILITSIAVTIIVIRCSTVNKETNTLPRIAIAGLAIESSTFSPALTHEEACHAKIGDTILTSYPFFAPGSTKYKRAQWFPILIGRALPGGIVTREAYESLMT